MWAERLGAVLHAEGFDTVEVWPSVYYKRVPEGSLVISVYVDDLIMFGDLLELSEALGRIRTQVHMEDPRTLGSSWG